MAGRYAILTPDWMLRGWDGLPRVVVNWITGEQRALTPDGLYVARACDGQTDFNSLAFLPTHLAILDLLVSHGIAMECPRGLMVEPWQRYRKACNPRLSGLHWCVTGGCNLRCRHCHIEAPSNRYGELPFSAMAALVDQFVRANVLRVSISGGEPFLRTDLLDLIGLLAQKHIYLNRIFSNGLLIKQNHLAEIRKAGFCPAFQISFDGVGTHDQMRGADGTENRVIDAIRRVRAAGFPVAVATSVDRVNAPVLAETYRLMKTLDVQAWNVAAPQETGNWRHPRTAASLELQAQVFEPLLQAWVNDGRPFLIKLGGFYSGGDTRLLNGQDPKFPIRQVLGDVARQRGSKNSVGTVPCATTPVARKVPTPESYDCGSCREEPCLLPDGTLVPCPAYVDSILQDRMPNLLRQDLSKAWRRSRLREIANIRKQDILAKNPECANCDLLFKECSGGCRATALTETGDLFAKDPITCAIHKNGEKRRFQAIADQCP
jgi:Fe-coproporphyrin III synthase